MKRAKPRWRYQFGREHVDLPIVESEKARLRDMARRLEHPASTPEMRESGEVMLDELAMLLARARAAKIGSDVGTAKRLEAGERTARAVKQAIAKGSDPLNLTTDRNLRRIKKRRRK